MGYDYLIRLSVGKLQLTREQLLQITKAYNEILQQDKDGWFPIFGKEDHTSSFGYGGGNSDKLKENIVKLTSLFPEITFYIHYFYYDMTSLEIYSILDKEIKEILIKQPEEIDTGISKIFTSFNGDCYIDGEILYDPLQI